MLTLPQYIFMPQYLAKYMDIFTRYISFFSGKEFYFKYEY